MKFTPFFGLATLAASATAYELVWYTGQICTGERVWEFELDDSNKNSCHNVDQAGQYVPSMTMDQDDGEGEDDYVLLYSGKDCGGDLVGRGQSGCIKFEGSQVNSFQYVTFQKGKKTFRA